MGCKMLDLPLRQLSVGQVPNCQYLTGATAILDRMRRDLDHAFIAVFVPYHRLCETISRSVERLSVTRYQPPGGIGADQLSLGAFEELRQPRIDLDNASSTDDG
jgi:hypothetical protein